MYYKVFVKYYLNQPSSTNKISLTIDSAVANIIFWITSRRRYFWHIDGVRLKYNVFYNKNKII